ncbi:hypothetical protein F5146DRAFT_266666 [Armillaria mellea]|nr:hypothetical protein F5146DRAFT_266666 [Armillaria mellea]
MLRRAKPAATSIPAAQTKGPAPPRYRQIHIATFPCWSSSEAERVKEDKPTRVDPEHVLFYDSASGSLDVHFIRAILGLKNLYSDACNPSNVNSLEESLPF